MITAPAVADIAQAMDMIVNAVIQRVSAYVNKNGNPTVSVLVGYTTPGNEPIETVIHMSLNGGAKAITEATLKWNGVTAAHFEPDVNPGLPCKIRIHGDGTEPDLIGPPRASDKAVVATLAL